MQNDTDGLTHEEYIEELAEMGLSPEDLTQADDEPLRLTTESTQELAESFESFAMRMNAGKSFTELREMHMALEPKKHARSPKRHLLHKKAVENRKKRKRGGKK